MTTDGQTGTGYTVWDGYVACHAFRKISLKVAQVASHAASTVQLAASRRIIPVVLTHSTPRYVIPTTPTLTINVQHIIVHTFQTGSRAVLAVGKH